MSVCILILNYNVDKLIFWLQQTQLAGACNCFGASFDLQLAEYFPVVPFDCIQGDEEPRANLSIRESLCNKMEYL